MQFAWDVSRTAFADGAARFVELAGLVGDRWEAPPLHPLVIKQFGAELALRGWRRTA